jgi:UDP-N-acetylmuramoyl-tripeptide--D-alanyl-D-alanine ligase
MKSLMQWWLGVYLPKQYSSPKNRLKDSGMSGKLILYVKHWLIHPALRRVAKYYLIVLKRYFGLKVVAITGSAGKTTTKEMLASILKQSGNTVYSYANIDPVFNIPATILKCKPSTDYLVLEMGVEYPNEMDYYLWLAKPDVGIITNIYPTHMEFFGDIEGVYREKAKLIFSLEKDNYAVLNSDDKLLIKLGKKTKANVVWFGKGSSVKAQGVRTSSNYNTQFKLIVKNKSIKIDLPIPGMNSVNNALAASAVASIFGIPLIKIKNGIETYKPPAHRIAVNTLKSGAVLLDDSYNSNPAAFKITLEVFSKAFRKKKKIVVFGDMLELGQKEEHFHKMAGKDIIKNKIDILIGVGDLSKYTVDEVRKNGKSKAYWVKTYELVENILKKQINNNSAILVKGSHSVHLDKVADKLISK